MKERIESYSSTQTFYTLEPKEREIILRLISQVLPEFKETEGLRVLVRNIRVEVSMLDLRRRVPVTSSKGKSWEEYQQGSPSSIYIRLDSDKEMIVSGTEKSWA